MFSWPYFPRDLLVASSSALFPRKICKRDILSMYSLFGLFFSLWFTNVNLGYIHVKCPYLNSKVYESSQCRDLNPGGENNIQSSQPPGQTHVYLLLQLCALILPFSLVRLFPFLLYVVPAKAFPIFPFPMHVLSLPATSSDFQLP